ncbi:MAG TPA: hypothetical protein VGB20_02560 [bacterium]
MNRRAAAPRGDTSPGQPGGRASLRRGDVPPADAGGRAGSRGLVLISALSVLAAIVTLTATALLRSMRDHDLAQRTAARHQAFWMAESAVDESVFRMKYGASLTSLGPLTDPRGIYWADIVPGANPREFLITGHGQHAGDQRQIEMQVRFVPLGAYQYAMFADEHLDISGNVHTDSFDSDLGPYDLENPGANGDVGTNSDEAGGIEIQGGVDIHGGMVVGPGASGNPDAVVDYTGSAYNVTDDPDVTAAPEPFPLPPVIVPSNLTCSDYSVNGQEVVTLQSSIGVYCFDDLTIGAGSTILVDGPVRVYITGSLLMRGNSLFGASIDPTWLSVMLDSTSTATLGTSQAGTTEFYGGIYAPDATVNIGGNTQVFGAVTANEIDIYGNAAVHYDEAMSRIDDPTGIALARILAWWDF